MQPRTLNTCLILFCAVTYQADSALQCVDGEIRLTNNQEEIPTVKIVSTKSLEFPKEATLGNNNNHDDDSDTIDDTSNNIDGYYGNAINNDETLKNDDLNGSLEQDDGEINNNSKYCETVTADNSIYDNSVKYDITYDTSNNLYEFNIPADMETFDEKERVNDDNQVTKNVEKSSDYLTLLNKKEEFINKLTIDEINGNLDECQAAKIIEPLASIIIASQPDLINHIDFNNNCHENQTKITNKDFLLKNKVILEKNDSKTIDSAKYKNKKCKSTPVIDNKNYLVKINSPVVHLISLKPRKINELTIKNKQLSFLFGSSLSSNNPMNFELNVCPANAIFFSPNPCKLCLSSSIKPQFVVYSTKPTQSASCNFSSRSKTDKLVPTYALQSGAIITKISNPRVTIPSLLAPSITACDITKPRIVNANMENPRSQIVRSRYTSPYIINPIVLDYWTYRDYYNTLHYFSKIILSYNLKPNAVSSVYPSITSKSLLHSKESLLKCAALTMKFEAANSIGQNCLRSTHKLHPFLNFKLISRRSSSRPIIATAFLRSCHYKNYLTNVCSLKMPILSYFFYSKFTSNNSPSHITAYFWYPSVSFKDRPALPQVKLALLIFHLNNSFKSSLSPVLNSIKYPASKKILKCSNSCRLDQKGPCDYVPF